MSDTPKTIGYDHQTWVAAIPHNRQDLIDELMWQWEYNHAEHCGCDKDKDEACAWPPPDLSGLSHE